MSTSEEWIRPPELRTAEETEDGERHATWLELFFDLVFVAAVGRLAHVLGEDVGWRGVAVYAALFVPVWWAWIGATFYSDRFDTDDLADRVLALAQMAAAAAMAVNVDHALDSSGAAFALSYAAFRAILVAQYLYAGRHAPEARALCRRWALGFAIAAVLWAISALVPPPLRYGLWAAGIAVDFLTPITAGRIHRDVPTDTTHLPERFGLFIIIVLGESIVAVVTTLDRKVWGLPGASAAFLALVVAFSLWWIYFGNLDGTAIRAARREGRTVLYQVWLYAHFPLAAALAATGVAVGHILAMPPGGEMKEADRWLLCGAFALCVAAIGVLDRVYAAAGSPRSSTVQAVWRFGGAAFALLVGALGAEMRPVEVMAFLAALGIIQVVTDPPRHREEIGDGDDDGGSDDDGRAAVGNPPR
ncbi:MAG TPA: low temperature requirement protein A [Longimicrobium sp.]|nr:low temperature requirement protein A [Longimicrobium sp.]